MMKAIQYFRKTPSYYGQVFEDFKITPPIIVAHAILPFIPEIFFQSVMFINRRRQQKVILRR